MKHITSYKNKKSQKIRHFLPINITVASRTKIKSRKPLQIKGFWDFAHYSNSTNGLILDDLLTKWEEMGYRFCSLKELTGA